MEISEWFKGFENGIARLTEDQRETFFAECGKNCVNCGTLQIYRKLYEDSDGDLDEFFAKAGELARQNFQRDNLRIRPPRQPALQDANFGTPITDVRILCIIRTILLRVMPAEVLGCCVSTDYFQQ